MSIPDVLCVARYTFDSFENPTRSLTRKSSKHHVCAIGLGGNDGWGGDIFLPSFGVVIYDR